MKLSEFGNKLSSESGINILMDDLGQAMSVNRDMLMLGGGNPAHIPGVGKVFRESMERILNSGNTFEECVGNYDPPQGNPLFIAELASLFRKMYGWEITTKNIALTNGSQSAFFLLFNMFAGKFPDGSTKKILLPLTPEYIGYSDVGISGNPLFTSIRPEINFLGDDLFKYSIDFSSLVIDNSIGAICVSRPTNPTGNVLTDSEVEKLIAISRKNNIPLIIDNAYGTPFPNIIFTDAKPYWDENVVMCMSLSKLGLPGLRTGIIVASEEIISAINRMNAVINLAPGSMGAAITENIVRSGEIIKMSREIIRPFYQAKAEKAVELFRENLKGLDYLIHKPEGALFLWIWFRGMKTDCGTLYERLKKRGVLVVPGHYFFPGLEEEWEHKNECIRVNYSQSDEVVSKGIELIAEEVRKAY